VPQRPLDTPRALKRRRQLLDGGFAFFATGDYDDIQISDIAEQIGVSHGLIFQHFGSKKGFYVAILSDTIDQFLTRTAPDPKLPAEQQLGASLRAYVDWAAEHPEGFTSMMRAAPRFEELEALIEDARRAGIERIALGAGVDPRDPRVVIALRGWIGGMENSLAEWLRQEMPLESDQLVELMTASLVSAIGWAQGQD